MPQFEFRFLVCAFLPSVPLSLIILLPFYGIVSNEGGAVFVAILIATSGILGLVVDGARHMLEKFLYSGKETYLWPETTPQELKKITEELRKLKEKDKKVDRSVYQFYVSRWEGYFHVYEFYSNFALSTLIGLTLLVFVGNTFSLKKVPIDKADVLEWLLIILVFFCIFFSVYYCYKKRQELDKTFTIKDKKINWKLPILFFLWWAIVTLNFSLEKYFRQGVFKMWWILIVIVAIISGTVFAMFVIYLRHKQRMAMVEKDTDLEKIYSPRELKNMLNAGLVVIAIGTSLLLLHLWLGFTRWFTVPGLILTFTGGALIGGYLLSIREIKHREKR